MQAFAHHIRKYPWTYGAFAFSLALVLTGWIWSYMMFRDATTPIILHFNSFSRINQIGGVRELAGIGTLGLTVAVLDFALALILADRDRTISYLLSLLGVFVSGLIFIAFAVIISVN